MGKQYILRDKDRVYWGTFKVVVERVEVRAGIGSGSRKLEDLLCGDEVHALDIHAGIGDSELVRFEHVAGRFGEHLAMRYFCDTKLNERKNACLGA